MIGKDALRRQELMRRKKAELGRQAREESLSSMRDAMTTFKSHLEAFALKHRAEIRANPRFREQFHQMCAHAGVDPLASNKSAWNALLGLGNFYYELGVCVVEACIATRGRNGGLLELSQLLRLVRARRGSAADPVSADDVLQAVKKLRSLDKSFSVVRGAHGTFVSSVPRELDADLPEVLAAAEATGYVSVRSLSERPQWTPARAELALQGMLKEGTCMIDDGGPGGQRLYWFPVLASVDPEAGGAVTGE